MSGAAAIGPQAVLHDDARTRLGSLLATLTPTRFACGGTVPVGALPVISFTTDSMSTIFKHTSQVLSFPLDAEQIAIVKSLAHKSGVGQGTETVINSQIRRSWELHPAQINVNFAVKAESKETTHSESQTCKKSKKVQRGRATESREGAESAIESIISTIKRELEVGDWEVSAEFYKMLVYEPGCFFRRHRDNERIDGTFGTLVLELPSVYTGSQLKVFSPSNPNDFETFFGGSAGSDGGRWSAFFADDQHEVSMLDSGHRAALVYTLVYKPTATTNGSTALAVAQPVDAIVVKEIADTMQRFAEETDHHYVGPRGMRPGQSSDDTPQPFHIECKKPAKLVIVLSHRYTPDGLLGMHSLKGQDKSVAKLIDLARRCSFENSDSFSSLARMCAETLVTFDPLAYQQASVEVASVVSDTLLKKEDRDNINVGAARSEKTAKVGTEYTFDAFLTMLQLVDEWGEACNLNTTTGGLVCLVPGDEITVLDTKPDKYPDRVNSLRGICRRGTNSGTDTHTGVDVDSWAEERESRAANGFESDDEEKMYGSPLIDAQNQDIQIECNELVFADPTFYHKSLIEMYMGTDTDQKETDVFDDFSSEKVEFLGNGGCSMGRWYSRAALVLWPREHRALVREQTYGAKKARERAARRQAAASCQAARAAHV